MELGANLGFKSRLSNAVRGSVLNKFQIKGFANDKGKSKEVDPSLGIGSEFGNFFLASKDLI